MSIPDAPTHLTASSQPNSTTATLTWTPPTNTTVTFYTLYVTSSNSDSYNVTGIVQNTKSIDLSFNYIYQMAVTATNNIGTSPLSIPVTGFSLIGKPSPPTGVSVVVNPPTDISLQGSASIFWNAPLLLNGSTISTYLIQGFVNGVLQNEWIDTYSTDTKTTINYLFYDVSYSFVVVARSNYGDSLTSKTPTIYIASEPLSEPTNISVYTTLQSTQVNVDWIEPVVRGRPILNHSVTLYNLKNNTTKTFTV